MAVGSDVKATTRAALKPAKKKSEKLESIRAMLTKIQGSKKKQANPGGVLPPGKSYKG